MTLRPGCGRGCQGRDDSRRGDERALGGLSRFRPCLGWLSLPNVPDHLGNYRIRFSAYLTDNGYKNPVYASLSASIIGVPVATFIASEQTYGV